MPGEVCGRPHCNLRLVKLGDNTQHTSHAKSDCKLSWLDPKMLPVGSAASS